VQFAQIPVFSNGHLEQEIKKLSSQQYVIRSLIFLNCGGTLDLTTQWFY